MSRPQQERHAAAVAAIQAAMAGRAWLDVPTSRGMVRIVVAADRRDQRGQPFLEVVVGDPTSDDPRFRIFNPPLLVADPTGTVLVGRRRFRRDPVAALASVIAQHGGAVKRRRNR